MVIMHPPGSRPGISNFAIIPAISPKTIQLSIPTAPPLLCVTAHFGCFAVPHLDCTKMPLCYSDGWKVPGGVPLPFANERVDTVEHGAVGFYSLQGKPSPVYAHHHRVVCGPRASRQATLARRVEPPATSPTHDVRNTPYGRHTLIDVVVTREDEVHPVPREDWLEVSTHTLVAAVPRGAVGGSVQERDL